MKIYGLPSYFDILIHPIHHEPIQFWLFYPDSRDGRCCSHGTFLQGSFCDVCPTQMTSMRRNVCAVMTHIFVTKKSGKWCVIITGTVHVSCQNCHVLWRTQTKNCYLVLPGGHEAEHCSIFRWPLVLGFRIPPLGTPISHGNPYRFKKNNTRVER